MDKSSTAPVTVVREIGACLLNNWRLIRPGLGTTGIFLEVGCFQSLCSQVHKLHLPDGILLPGVCSETYRQNLDLRRLESQGDETATRGLESLERKGKMCIQPALSCKCCAHGVHLVNSREHENFLPSAHAGVKK